MANEPVAIEYNEALKPLEDVLTRVRRPGDFFVSGRMETPMPRVDVEDVGVLSFPVPAEQIDRIIQRAVRAPFGRGEETLLDTSVRKVWQLPPAKVRISGKSWPATLESIVKRVCEGLGCGKASVTASLYKLLVYDEGGFFKPHRDTEKAEGMFGTLVIALPSFHRGGELMIRHAGREVSVELSSAEVSELTFVAFYTDCEHEVLPLTEGNRVCLIYNLIQRPRARGRAKPLQAPEYEKEVDAVAEILEQALLPGSLPVKIAWLLEHQYSPAGLSFSALKNADAARVKVLSEAASRAGYAVHLGIVHIEECGSAEPQYYDYRDRRSRWHDDDDDDDDEAGSDEFEVIEVIDSNRYLDQWVSPQDVPVDFGKLPVEDNELLPAGALDDEPPDEQRLTEATGNEGASFERAYHRAALVIWRRDRYAEVLLQAGAGAALPYLKERIADCASTPAKRREVESLANLIVDAWREGHPDGASWGTRPAGDRPLMLDLLNQLGDADVLARFIAEIVIGRFDGSENQGLVASTRLLGATRSGELFSILCTGKMPRFHVACVDLLRLLTERQSAGIGDDPWRDALHRIAQAIVAGLQEIGASATPENDADWQPAPKVTPVTSSEIADLLDALEALDAETLRTSAASAITARPRQFDPGKIVTPALELLLQRHADSARRDDSFELLWRHCAEWLLARSEHPPLPPQDWRQEAKLSCSCEDCRELQAFALNPDEQTHRFRVRKDRRQHLHRNIDRHGLDMTHETERQGSPQTLVCTKTRRTYERRCHQYKKDISSISTLIRVMSGAGGEAADLSARLKAAVERTA